MVGIVVGVILFVVVLELFLLLLMAQSGMLGRGADRRTLVGVMVVVGVAGGLVGSLFGWGIHSDRQALAKPPPLFQGEAGSAFVALHHKLLSGEQPLSNLEAARSAMLAMRTSHQRTMPVFPQARLLGAAALGEELRPFAAASYELDGHGRFTLFTLRADEGVHLEDASPKGELPRYVASRDGVQVLYWHHPSGPTTRSFHPTRWVSIAVGGPPAEHAFWDLVIRTQIR